MRLDPSEEMERLGKILEEHAGWTDDDLSQKIREWAKDTIASLPGDRQEAIDYLTRRVKFLCQKILFDPLDCGPLRDDAQIVGPGLATSERVLEDWRTVATLANETCPVAESSTRVHRLACSVIKWARVICPEDGSRSSGSILSVTDPSLASIKHNIYLSRVKDAEALHSERLRQVNSQANATRWQEEAASWREAARSIEADRKRTEEEHRARLEENIQQLQTVMSTAEQFMQAGLESRRAQAPDFELRLAECKGVDQNQTWEISDLQNRLRRLGGV